MTEGDDDKWWLQDDTCDYAHANQSIFKHRFSAQEKLSRMLQQQQHQQPQQEEQFLSMHPRRSRGEEGEEQHYVSMQQGPLRPTRSGSSYHSTYSEQPQQQQQWDLHNVIRDEAESLHHHPSSSLGQQRYHSSSPPAAGTALSNGSPSLYESGGGGATSYMRSSVSYPLSQQSDGLHESSLAYPSYPQHHQQEYESLRTNGSSGLPYSTSSNMPAAGFSHPMYENGDREGEPHYAPVGAYAGPQHHHHHDPTRVSLSSSSLLPQQENMYVVPSAAVMRAPRALPLHPSVMDPYTAIPQEYRSGGNDGYGRSSSSVQHGQPPSSSTTGVLDPAPQRTLSIGVPLAAQPHSRPMTAGMQGPSSSSERSAYYYRPMEAHPYSMPQSLLQSTFTTDMMYSDHAREEGLQRIRATTSMPEVPILSSMTTTVGGGSGFPPAKGSFFAESGIPRASSSSPLTAAGESFSAYSTSQPLPSLRPAPSSAAAAATTTESEVWGPLPCDLTSTRPVSRVPMLIVTGTGQQMRVANTAVDLLDFTTNQARRYGFCDYSGKYLQLRAGQVSLMDAPLREEEIREGLSMSPCKIVRRHLVLTSKRASIEERLIMAPIPQANPITARAPNVDLQRVTVLPTSTAATEDPLRPSSIDASFLFRQMIPALPEEPPTYDSLYPPSWRRNQTSDQNNSRRQRKDVVHLVERELLHWRRVVDQMKQRNMGNNISGEPGLMSTGVSRTTEQDGVSNNSENGKQADFPPPSYDESQLLMHPTQHPSYFTGAFYMEALRDYLTSFYEKERASNSNAEDGDGAEGDAVTAEQVRSEEGNVNNTSAGTTSITVASKPVSVVSLSVAANNLLSRPSPMLAPPIMPSNDNNSNSTQLLPAAEYATGAGGSLAPTVPTTSLPLTGGGVAPMSQTQTWVPMTAPMLPQQAVTSTSSSSAPSSALFAPFNSTAFSSDLIPYSATKQSSSTTVTTNERQASQPAVTLSSLLSYLPQPKLPNAALSTAYVAPKVPEAGTTTVPLDRSPVGVSALLSQLSNTPMGPSVPVGLPSPGTQFASSTQQEQTPLLPTTTTTTTTAAATTQSTSSSSALVSDLGGAASSPPLRTSAQQLALSVPPPLPLHSAASQETFVSSSSSVPATLRAWSSVQQQHDGTQAGGAPIVIQSSPSMAGTSFSSTVSREVSILQTTAGASSMLTTMIAERSPSVGMNHRQSILEKLARGY